MSKKNIIDTMILKDYEYSMFLDKLYNKRDLEYFVRCAKTKHHIPCDCCPREETYTHFYTIPNVHCATRAYPKINKIVKYCKNELVGIHTFERTIGLFGDLELGELYFKSFPFDIYKGNDVVIVIGEGIDSTDAYTMAKIVGVENFLSEETKHALYKRFIKEVSYV